MVKQICERCQVCACDCCWVDNRCRHCGHRVRVPYDNGASERTYKVGDTLRDRSGREALICSVDCYDRIVFIDVGRSIVWNRRFEQVKNSQRITREELDRFGFKDWS